MPAAGAPARRSQFFLVLDGFFDITHCFGHMEAYFEVTGGWSIQGRSFLFNFHGHSSWEKLSHPWSKFGFGIFVAVLVFFFGLAQSYLCIIN